MRLCSLLQQISLLLILCLLIPDAQAASITINSNRNWSTVGGGSGPGGRPSAADTLTISNGATLTVDVNNAAIGSIQIAGTNNGTLSFNNNSVLTVSGSVTMGNGAFSGNLNMSAGGTLSLQQFVYVAGTFTPGSGTVRLTANNTLPNTATLASFNNLVQLNSGTTTTLSRDVSVSGVLTLTAGVIETNGKILSLNANCPGSVSRSAGYVSGFLRMRYPSGTTSCTYHLGSATGYAPITLTVAANSAGTLTAASIGAEHPQIATSGIDQNRDVSRHWTLRQSGDTLVASSWGITLNYNAGDLDLNASSFNFVLGIYNGTAWNLPTGFTRGTNSISLSGQSAAFSTGLSFAVGEPVPVCNPPSDITGVTLSCVCDNFSRANLNPSTIYNADWSLSTSGGSFGVPKIINPGSLRLTDNSATVATAATVPANFPAAGNLIVVEFSAYAYNGNGGADGMAVILSDSAILPQAGAYGGSLGYAQKVGSDCTNPAGCAGFAGGWLGVALDEYGNFSSASEGRQGGPGSVPDAVAARGSGAGASTASTNYPYLAGTGSLNPQVDSVSSTSFAPGHSYRVMVDARNYAPTNKTATVSVYRDTTGTSSFSTANRLLNFDAYVKNPAQAAVPVDWKLSFTGSTGGSTNIHEISGLKICAQTVNPPTSFRIDIDNLNPATCSTAPGGRPVITITALNINGTTNINYNKTVILTAKLANGSVSSTAVWSKLQGAGTLSGTQYTFSTADNGIAKFVLTDNVQEDIYVNVIENGAAYGVTYSSPMQFRGGSFAVDNIDSLNLNTGGGVVGGRPHLFRITRGNACGTDTTYSGAKNLDGWYTANSNHPAAAASPSLCLPDAGGNCSGTLGTCAVLPASPPALAAASNNLPTLNFTNGVANVCLKTSDVGSYSFSVRDDSNVSAPIAGAAGGLIARPFAILVYDVRNGSGQGNPATAANTNPLAPDNVNNPEDAPLFTSAGTSFSISAGGYLWSAGADLDNNGLPDSNANYAALSASGLAPKYTDTVLLTALSTPNSFVPLASRGGIAGSLSGNPGASVIITAGGSGSNNNLMYSEVGSFNLSASPSASYLASGVDLRPRTVIFANPSLSTRSTWVGRFNPAYFDVNSSSLLNRSEIGGGTGCSPASNFTYMEENIYFQFSLSAKGGTAGSLSNYFGSYAKLDASNWLVLGANNSLGVGVLGSQVAVNGGTCNAVFDQSTPSQTRFAACSGPTPANVVRTAGPRLALLATPANPVWSLGQASFAGEMVLRRADLADGPYRKLQFGIAPRDRDGVSLLPARLNLDADQNLSAERHMLNETELRYGRMLIDNAYGSELMNLPVAVQAQYWDGSKYVKSQDDNCTPLLRTNFSMSNHTGDGGGKVRINPGNMSTGNLPLNSGNLSSGAGVIRVGKPLTPPAVTDKGGVNLNSLLNYLPGSGRLTFGLYKAGPVIYIREIY